MPNLGTEVQDEVPGLQLAIFGDAASVVAARAKPTFNGNGDRGRTTRLRA